MFKYNFNEMRILTLFVVCFFISCNAQKPKNVQNVKKPNIIVVLCDDLGYNDVGFNGSKDIITPELDQLANNGTVFTSAYVAHPFCGPSRAALMTGRYPQMIGCQYNLSDSGEKTLEGVPVNEPFMSNSLKDAGYYTSVIGKWHLGDAPQFHPNQRGFDDFYGFLGGGHDYFPEKYKVAYDAQVKKGINPIHVYIHPLEHNGKQVTDDKDYLTDILSNQATRVIKDATAKKKPFFMYVSYNAPHVPLQAKDEDLKVFENIKDKDRKAYAAMVYSVDRGVGQIVKTLKETNQFDNTLIVFLSDNGGNTDHGANNTPLKGTKGDTFEGGFRVPMFFHWPNKVPAGKRYDYPVNSLDLYPTFVNMAKGTLPISKKLDGKDILNDVITGSNAHKDQMIYALRFRNGYIDVSARKDDWKIVRVGMEPWQLINITNDIGEKQNLSYRYPDRLNAMIHEMKTWTDTNVLPMWWNSASEARIWKATGMPNYNETFRTD